ncbi:MAG: Gfo/Idh/MocA family protein [Planctomycetota bacterium]|jgi:predicted dehydrogenase
MPNITRRDFVKSTLINCAALTLSSGLAKAAPFSKIRGANDDIRVAVVGLRIKGQQHMNIFHNLPGVRVIALCDVDRAILAERVTEFNKRKENVDSHVDVRHILDRKDIDAIVVATPNHWHSLLVVWACQAGKDIYVEKPVSHNIWEGRKAVEAARKYKRIVQAGTQSRSDIGLQEAVEYIKQGNLGKIKLTRSLCYRRRESIGKVNAPQTIPDSVDYNLWSGPRKMPPLMRKNLHYDWHWVWPTGNGEIGNQGIHEIDLCRWALSEDKLPTNVISIGGRFGYVDDGETPNTQIAVFEYPSAPLIFEARGLPRKAQDPAMDNHLGIRVGVIIQCENGCFAGGRGGGWIYDNNGNKIKQFEGDGGGNHQANFIKAVHSRKTSDLNSDILHGHISSAMCHMANISHRIGQQTDPEEIKEALKTDSTALDTFECFREHLSANGVDIKQAQAVLGPKLKMKPKREKFTGRFSEPANQLLTDSYRKPFDVPKKV